MIVRFNVVNYLIGEGIRNLFKNKKSTMSALMIMCATMLIFGLFFVIGENLNAFVENVADAQEIRVILDNDATDSEIEEVGKEILEIDGVRNAEFVSKDEALDYMKDMLGYEVLDGYSERNIFSTAYNVTLTDLKMNNEVQANIKQIPHVKKIVSSNQVISQIISLAKGVRIVTAGILGLLIIISVSISSPKTHTFPVILSMFQYPHIFDYFMSSARAISPAMAEAVTVAAEPKYTLELGCPARPLKFLVPVLIRTSFSPITP